MALRLLDRQFVAHHKEPSRGLTFVALTNSDQLSARFDLGSGDLMSSTVAQAFVNAFVTGSLGTEPQRPWVVNPRPPCMTENKTKPTDASV